MSNEFNFPKMKYDDFKCIFDKLNKMDDSNYELVQIKKFLTNKECNTLIKECQYEKVNLSQINGSTDTNYVQQSIRRSYTGYVYDRKNEISKKITDLTSMISGFPSENMEALQLVRYEQGGFFIEHHDAGVTGQLSTRLYTFLIYLNDVEEGGETFFSTINQTVKPEKGSCVIFKSTKDNKILQKSLHKGNEVKVGYKCICTKWVHSEKVTDGIRGDLK